MITTQAADETMEEAIGAVRRPKWQPEIQTHPPKLAAAVGGSAVSKTTGTNDASPPQDLQPQQSHFRLLNLPIELVEKIYKNMIRAGHVNILRVSRQVYDQSSHFVESHGFYRVKLDGDTKWVDVDMKRAVMSQEEAQSIRNLEIHCIVSQTAGTQSCYFGLLFVRSLNKIIASKTRRKRCHVIYEPCIIDQQSPWSCSIAKSIFGLFCLLTNFERMSIIYAPTQKIGGDKIARLTTQQERQEILRTIGDVLKPSLGPATEIESLRGLEFSPLDYNNQKVAIVIRNTYDDFMWLVQRFLDE